MLRLPTFDEVGQTVGEYVADRDRPERMHPPPTLISAGDQKTPGPWSRSPVMRVEGYVSPVP